MGFRDLNIKIKYDSDNSDILNEFYIPVLSRSVEYYRLSGFFSSTSLAVSAQGLEDFIKNNGKMKLVCSAILSKEDVEKIQEVYDSPAELIAEKFLIDYDNISNIFVKDNLAALGFMIANGNLEIKIAILEESKGIFHSKTGIMIDEDDNMLSFSGSDNETAHGWKYNIEEFKVFKSWINGQDEYFIEDLYNFNQYWENLTFKSQVIDIPRAIRNKLIKLAPSDIEEVHIFNNIFDEVDDVDPEPQRSFELRDYQKEAINNWIDAGKRGIFEMATGTGKTFTSLGCLDVVKKECSSNYDPLLTVIVMPTAHLVDQWEEDVLKFDFDVVIKAYSANSSWKKDLPDYLLDLSIGELENVVILTTHTTASGSEFRDMVKECGVDSFLIVDEVHGIGSKTHKLALEPFYNYRLGVSATPERWMDDVGNEAIFSFFGDIVYKFTLSDALIRINPSTGKTFLTPYDYYPIFVELTDDEFDDYATYSSIIAQLYSKLKSNPKNKSEIKLQIKNKLLARQKILNIAENKYIEFRNLFSNIYEQSEGKLKNLLIYCHNSDQLNKVSNILNDFDLIKHKFTGSETISDRLILLEQFSKGNVNALVAMKCLDEGVDVPSAEIAIIMASTSNPREYIQRRGRILRRYENKDLAIIYDMIVTMSDRQIRRLSSSERNLELQIMEKEAERYREFARDAKNYDYCYDRLNEYFGRILNG